jgi:hypothetical protein
MVFWKRFLGQSSKGEKNEKKVGENVMTISSQDSLNHHTGQNQLVQS